MLPEEFRKKLPDPEMVLRVQDVSDAVLYALSCPASVEVNSEYFSV